jgi:hypothetical protein
LRKKTLNSTPKESQLDTQSIQVGFFFSNHRVYNYQHGKKLISSTTNKTQNTTKPKTKTKTQPAKEVAHTNDQLQQPKKQIFLLKKHPA